MSRASPLAAFSVVCMSVGMVHPERDCSGVEFRRGDAVRVMRDATLELDGREVMTEGTVA